MKYHFKKIVFTTSLICLLCLLPQITMAQPGFGDDVDDEIPEQPAAFIDGLLAVGIVAGVAYGLKKSKK